MQSSTVLLAAAILEALCDRCGSLVVSGGAALELLRLLCLADWLPGRSKANWFSVATLRTTTSESFAALRDCALRQRDHALAFDQFGQIAGAKVHMRSDLAWRICKIEQLDCRPEVIERPG